ncbi:MAG: ATP synthase subunit I [Desulfosudaceae bacterium]
MTTTISEPLLPLRQMRKKFCTTALLVALGAGSGLMLAGFVPLGKGLIFGTLFSIINFTLLARSLPARIGKDKRKTFLTALGSKLFRFLILAVPMITAIRSDTYHLATTVVGIFMVQAVILANYSTYPILSRLMKSRYSGDR